MKIKPFVQALVAGSAGFFVTATTTSFHPLIGAVSLGISFPSLVSAYHETDKQLQVIKSIASVVLSTLAGVLLSQYLNPPITFTACFLLQAKIYVLAGVTGFVGIAVVSVIMSLIKLTKTTRPPEGPLEAMLFKD